MEEEMREQARMDFCRLCQRIISRQMDEDAGEQRHVNGFCPMGCGETLYLHRSGDIRCLGRDCPAANSAAVILQDKGTTHLVYISSDGMATVRHPLRERIGNQLMVCDMVPFAAEPGLWQERRDGGWEAVDAPR